ncbi:hypothetical protein TSOC_003437 [Tetrabaena socialis]|uniref:Vacuolar ATPase assembly protein VMA22 n=1 Tax=Tetrabaena socialis TaxID=47790 RepID=A0A2J8ABK3_9CHLO|nr:hypothetical protein TSOC_003437 [Tetrabaena socialis]|eukprot:PNH09905.1 hypothetical protein TSOC_003437 [Tetrabaena socialis]
MTDPRHNHRDRHCYAILRSGSYVPRVKRFEPGNYVYVLQRNRFSTLQLPTLEHVLRGGTCTASNPHCQPCPWARGSAPPAPPRAPPQPSGGGGGGGGGGDPLHWFGVLVPPALKEAQGQFGAVLDMCVQLANAAQRMAPAP